MKGGRSWQHQTLIISHAINSRSTSISSYVSNQVSSSRRRANRGDSSIGSMSGGSSGSSSCIEWCSSARITMGCQTKTILYNLVPLPKMICAFTQYIDKWTSSPFHSRSSSSNRTRAGGLEAPVGSWPLRRARAHTRTHGDTRAFTGTSLDKLVVGLWRARSLKQMDPCPAIRSCVSNSASVKNEVPDMLCI